MLGAIAATVALLATSPVQGSLFGPVVSAKGTTFTITTSLSPNGKAVVSAGSARITEQAPAPRSALKVGACVMANGSKSTKGVVAATRISISTAVKGTCGGGFAFPRGGSGRFRPQGSAGGSTGRPPNGFRRPGNFGFAFGKVTKVSGSTLTVKGIAFGTSKVATTTTVSFTSKTTLSELKTIKATAVQTKMCAFVRGTSTNKGETVKATDVSLTPQTKGSCTTGFRRPGS